MYNAKSTRISDKNGIRALCRAPEGKIPGSAKKETEKSEMKVILASASPRRRELLSAVCSEFNIKVAEVDETLPEKIHPREGVELLAIRKGRAVVFGEADEAPAGRSFTEKGAEGAAFSAARSVSLGEITDNARDAACSSLVISSDTLVELNGKPLGKPESREHARNMLRELSGKRHNVHTGIAVHYNGRVASGVATTGVLFRDITNDEIEEYVESGEPMDKAGAYAIQGLGGKFVKGFDGDFDTVVGFSIRLFKELLDSLGVDIRELG